MPSRKLKEFLDSHQIKYMTVRHSPAYTTQEVAQSIHIHGHQVAKVVILKINGELTMAVTTADRMVDLPGIMRMANTSDVMLADEKEFESRFPGVETGAMPPFGNLYDLDVFVDRALTKNKDIIFNSGSHTEVIRMSYADFERLVHPRVYSPVHPEEVMETV